MISQEKYFFKISSFTRRVSFLPYTSWRIKVYGPSFSTIWNGPSHSIWNFVCLPFSSWALSHFETKSPTSKVLFPTHPISNQDLIMFWCLAWIFFSLSLHSSNFNIWDNLNQSEEQGCSSIDCTKANEGKATLEGNTTYFP